MSTHLTSKTLGMRRLATAIAAGAFTASTLLPTGALAVESPPNQAPGQQTQPTSLPFCSDKSWSSPTVIIHTSLFPDKTQQAAMDAAVRDVNAQMALVGGSSVHIAKTSDTTDDFHETPYGDTSPTIHLGFLNLPDSELGLTNTEISCEHYITIDRDSSWDYGTPEDSRTDGDRYYDAQQKDPGNKFYFRISYQHELLHAFGVAADDPDGHPDNAYSFLNYGNRPWANVAPSAMIRPLPYDVGQLRKLYPASGTRTEVAALNTWIDRADFTGAGDVMSQKLLCAPSVGKTSDPNNEFQPNCGDKGATSICPGDTVQLRYVAANYSTEPVTITANYWFSVDDEWQQTDVISSSAAGYWLDPAHSVEQPAAVVVPSLAGVTTANYHLIVRLTATSTSGVVVHDSIPMRGLLTRPASCSAASNDTLNVNPSTSPISR